MPNSFRQAQILGVTIHAITLAEMLAYIEDTLTAKRRALITNLNAYAMNLAYEQLWFREFINRSDLVFCDGFGVKWAARLLGQKLSARFTPPDMIWQIATLAERCGFSFFFLGGLPGVAERAAQRLRERFPDLHILAAYHGYFDKTPGSFENEAVIELINTLSPDILFVGFGMPLQEKWLSENWDRLDARVAFTVGAFFDFVSGQVRRGPHWMTNHGLEWLARLVIEPRRLWRRYLIGNPLFFYRVLKQKFGLWRP